MDQQVVMALTKMLETGGSIAIWGIIVWKIFGFFQTLTMGIIVYLCVRAACKAIIACK